MEVGSKTNDEETKVFAIAKILYYKIIRAAVWFWKHDKIFPRFLVERVNHTIDSFDRSTGFIHLIQ